MGGLELLIIAFVFGVFGTFVWSLVDVLSRPEHQWKAIRQERIVWVLVILFAGLPGTIAYLAAIRPKLARAALAPIPAHPMLTAAPPGWYPDPQGSGMLRWFDGMQWTQAFAPPGSVPMGGMPMGGMQHMQHMQQPMGGMPMGGMQQPMGGMPMQHPGMMGGMPTGQPPGPTGY